ncbi:MULTISPECIES: IclR family transcriptional regulator C-terminal domain-containing protein [unclassified Pseudodesulfovibrio]|uniref:IclR family transcriptional regulator n=1 Tax=unclassified Pseudodesulfovibrio TaxID=2661612 RepID=UPI000FEB69EE|nr:MULTISPECIES: IclR family transcriptional regulator C-terminal domain-containing protein [unclassified Pseudodesulfovibrio]MCJ2163418.1 helix-turn-helix domain-containing protein [Pseudodesulfovibrio sp. S3-i]RWU06655.1 IclR family transcriptional regulator [Pseudodesulfovibrio sp. S3]
MVKKEKTKRDNPLFVASLEKGVVLLEAFDEGHRRLGLNDLVKLTGLNKSAVQRFLHTWVALGYLSKNAETKLYRLTPKVMSLGYNFLRGERLVEVATPFLLDARERTGNSVYLGTLYDTSIIYLIRLPQRLLLLEGTLPGRRVPAFCGGRAFLSCLDDTEILSILDRSNRSAITPYTITDIDENMREIATVREKGFCISQQEQLMGEIAVSAPVRDLQGVPRAAIYISARITEWPPDRVESELAPIALETAGIISRQL